MGEKVEHVVADSGAFIRNADLYKIGREIYTVPEVVREIRDKATKQRLQVLPYSLQYRQPSSESVRVVSEFSKKTGDYRSLSAVDIKLLALTYQLEKEHVGTEHIRCQPESKKTWTASKQMLQKPTEIAGFYLKGHKNKITDGLVPATLDVEGTDNANDGESQQSSQPIESQVADMEHRTQGLEISPDSNRPKLEDCELKSNEISDDNISEPVIHDQDTSKVKQKSSEECVKLEVVDANVDNEDDETEAKTPDDDDERPTKIEDDVEGIVVPEGCIKDEDEEDNIETGAGTDSDEDDDDDDSGWITPSNIAHVRASMGDVNTERAQVAVGCLTTDFAMQNVLIQMGLNVISVDGMLIRRAKSYVLRCFSCMKVTSIMTKAFCPHCGNNTLRRLTMSVDDDGQVHYHMSMRRKINTKGMKYSLPMPKGGKHSHNPILCEDQKEAHNRASKKYTDKVDILDPDYVTHGHSPFAMNDVYSRASHVRGQGPHAVKKTYGKRRK